jgi:hypothetical protein
VPTQSAELRKCLTCDRWGGQRRIGLLPESIEYEADEEQGPCCDGPWHGILRGPRNACGHWKLWQALQLPPATPLAAASGTRRLIALDDAAALGPVHAGQIVVTGSPGGLASARHALTTSPFLIFFNDAGRGRHDAGIAGLHRLQAAGIAAAAYAHHSARIGDARDGLENGVLSVANRKAQELGVSTGMKVQEAVLLAAQAAHGDQS